MNGEFHKLLYPLLGGMALIIGSLLAYGYNSIQGDIEHGRQDRDQLRLEIQESRASLRTMYLHFNERVGKLERDLAFLQGSEPAYPPRQPHGPSEWRP